MTFFRSLFVSVALAATMVAALPGAAHASHVRGGYFSWRLVGPGPLDVEFHSVQEFHASDVTPFPINPGDGDPTVIGPVSTIFTGTDAAGESYRIVEYTARHTYPTAGPFTAYLGLGSNSLNCCRLLSTFLINASNSDYRFETVVDLRSTNSGSPVAAIPPFPSVPMILRIPAGATNASVFFSVTDPDNDPFTCVMATPAQSGIPTVATAPSPSFDVLHVTTSTGPPGCKLLWDTRGTTPGDKYAVQVQLDENHPGNSNTGRVALDFLLEIAAPDCGDGFVQSGSGEECDGLDDSLCPGACRPPNGPNECRCAVCGDDIRDPGEQCDGTAEGVFGQCPGQCIALGPNRCKCPVCGDNEWTASVGEQCDGTDSPACPGACLGNCQCAVCGNNVTEGPEQCDGTSDAACPGRCVSDCTCAVCGDNVAEGPEQCDGTADAACPGRCLVNCRCAVCGDNVAQGPEQCDGADAAACPGACLANCTCGTCGDGAVNAPGEQCDGAADAACPGRCLVNCRCAVCGDNVAQGPEQCDGADAAACPGACLANCTCQICGDNVVEGSEQCDGASDAACPGLCRPFGDPNACKCPVCGDNDVNAPGEMCDGSDDAACPTKCTATCICAVCGDNLTEAPAETCDGTDDAACPGACRPPGGANECHCPVCGDGEIDVAGEECDGTDDAACPGACAAANAPNACRCPRCGDGIVNQPSEECDGAATGSCVGGICQPDCTYATCGDCTLDPGETCDPPNREICNNLTDDDGDGKLNCDDSDCPPGRTCKHPKDAVLNALVSTLPCAASADCNNLCSHDLTTPCTSNTQCAALATGSVCIDGAKCVCPDLPPAGFQTCGATCAAVFGCGCIRNDPARIRFATRPGAPDLLKIHGRFLVEQGAMDPPSDGFTLLLVNASGVVYQGSLHPGDLTGRPGNYAFKDATAKTGAGVRDGLARVSVRIKMVKGQLNYVFKADVYSDFSGATAIMTTQVIAGNATASLSGTWTPSGNGWKLTSFE